MWTTVARVFATTLPYDGRYRCLKVRTGPSAARPTGLVAERARTLRALASRDARRASRRLLDRLALAESPVSSSSRLLVQDAWAGLRGLARCPLAYRSAAPLAGARDEAHRQAPLPALGGGASLRRLSRRVYAAIDAIGRTARRHGCAPLTVRPRAARRGRACLRVACLGARRGVWRDVRYRVRLASLSLKRGMSVAMRRCRCDVLKSTETLSSAAELPLSSFRGRYRRGGPPRTLSAAARA